MKYSFYLSTVRLIPTFLLCSALIKSAVGNFDLKPDRTVYVEVDKEATFTWGYTPPSGTSVLINTWCKINPATNRCPTIPIMKKTPSDPRPVVRTDNIDYYSRTTGIAPYTMKIRNIRVSDDGTYVMRVTFDNGNSMSDQVRLVVLVKPVITKRTAGDRLTVTEGQKRVLDCGASIGNPKPFTIEWLWSGTIKQTRQTNFELQLVFNSTTRYESGLYRCIVRNRAGTTSYSITLDVVYPPENLQVIPAISGVVSVRQGSNVTLQCRAQGQPFPKYSWTRIRRLYREKITENSDASNLFFKKVEKHHADNYECAAVNVYGRKSLSVFLDVQYPPERMNFTINQNVSFVYAIKGTPVNMTCEAFSNPAASYRIGFAGSPTPKVIGRAFYIQSVTEVDDGLYECIASNGIGEPVKVSTRLIVVVAPREITLTGIPSSSRLDENVNLVLTCQMKGHPRPSIYWTLDNKQLTFDSRRFETNGSLPNIGQDTIYYSKIHFRPLHRFDNGEYKCFGMNYGGVIERKYPLDVQYAPYIIIYPRNVTIREYQSAELFCKAVGKPPLSAYIWRHNGIVRTESGERLYFRSATRLDGGKYTCAGINSVATGVAAVAYLTVTYKPEFTVTPVLSQTVNSSVTVRLICNATGVPKPLILWTKDGQPKILHTGEVLTLYNVGYLQKGAYYCEASNSIGNITAKSTLWINHIPVITTKDPASTKLGSDVGANVPPVKIVCAVDAYPAATVTWSKGSSRIVKGTPGYEIDDTSSAGTSYLTVIMSDNSKRGSYTCTATNRLGTVQQIYEILKRGSPHPPMKDSLKATDMLLLTDPPTVSVELRWVPGYSGGYPVSFTLYYKVQGERNFQQRDLGATTNNVYTIRGLKTSTTYEFTMIATNERGPSQRYEPYLQFTTKTAPPRRGGASIRRIGSSGTEVEVMWTINDYSRAKSIVIRYKRVIDIGWREIVLPSSQLNSTYIVKSLDSQRMYEFQIFIVYKDGTRGMPISAGQISPGGDSIVPGTKGLTKQDIIAIVVGVGGFLLIVIVICTLLVIRRKKKQGSNGRSFEMKVSSGGRGHSRGGVIGYSTVGSDVIRTGVPADHAEDDDEDVSVADSTQKNKARKDSPPSYDDHFSYYDGTDINTTSFQPRHPVGNTPAYSSFSALSNPKRPLIAEAAPVPKSESKTSLTGGRAAEISRKNRPPYESFDYRRDGRLPSYVDHEDRGYDEDMDPRSRRNGSRDQERYKYHQDPIEQKPRAGRGSSSGGVSTDDDLPSPPPFMREALTNMHSDSERVPGSMGERLGKNKNTLRSSPQHSPSSQRSGVSSNQYRSDVEYLDDEENYVGYMV